MGCFSIAWLVQLVVWLIIVCAIAAICKLLLPYVFNALGVAGGVVLQVINIIIVAVVAIFVIYVLYDLISCVSFPRVVR